MPYKNKKACIVPGCPGLSSTGNYCIVHSRQREQKYRVVQYQNKKLRNTAEWQRLRRQVLNEEVYCRVCGAVATQVDHIIPIPEGDNSRANLQALCKPCHSRKTLTESLNKVKG